jgi:NADH-quinone oxidoreductase subunit J
MEQIIFYIAAILAVASTAMVILSKNAIYAVLFLIMSLFAISIVFFTLGAPFIGMLEIIIYAGAIMVLFLFVVMMLNLGKANPDPDLQRPTRKQMILPGLFALALLVETLMVLTRGAPMIASSKIFGPREIGLALYGKHFLGVELASLVLLIGVIGGMHLGNAASAEEEKEKAAHASS